MKSKEAKEAITDNKFSILGYDALKRAIPMDWEKPLNNIWKPIHLVKTSLYNKDLD